MLGDHAMRQREADSVAGWFGGEEWNEDALKICTRNSYAAVRYLNHGPLQSRLIALAGNLNFDAAFALVWGDGFGGVADEI